MASPLTSPPPPSHCALTAATSWGRGWVYLRIAHSGRVDEHYLRGERDAKRYLAAMHPGAIEVPLAWFRAPIEAVAVEVAS